MFISRQFGYLALTERDSLGFGSDIHKEKSDVNFQMDCFDGERCLADWALREQRHGAAQEINGRG